MYFVESFNVLLISELGIDYWVMVIFDESGFFFISLVIVVIVDNIEIEIMFILEIFVFCLVGVFFMVILDVG